MNLAWMRFISVLVFIVTFYTQKRYLLVVYSLCSELGVEFDLPMVYFVREACVQT